ncbi:hypothetical protein IFT47_11855 [Pseudomonas sp. CFBP 13711]|uniref:hypothetical protein n=1 Tax=unclassified Pseudomonas TaxID=196821 RepID=UPI0017816689|nr:MULTISPECIES: hypothetical protein [unclassified Pseudomonas]MBD8707326.1 hypothetical protein [Pseudomonas sp. CFBP 13711]MBD8711294.1 hypothetical protein [Pseudomonas sp. CFBP 13715]
MSSFIVVTLTSILEVGSLALINWLLARTQPSGLRIIWYFFSLSVIVTAEIGLHARYTSAINEHGQFVGDYGHILELGLHFMSDLNTDLLVFLGLLVAIILPQLLSYVISGLFGVASMPLFAGRSTTIFVWAVIKSFTVCSGIWFTISIMGALGVFSIPNYPGMWLLSMLLLQLAFAMLWGYEQGKESLNVLINGANKRWPQLVRPLLIAHGWCTRRSKLHESA